jgi:hypothetical protein
VVNPKVCLVMLSGVISSATKKNKVLLLPPKGIDLAYVDHLLRTTFQNQEQRKRVELLKNPTTTDGQQSDFVEELKSTIAQFRRKEPGVGLFGIFSFGPSMTKKAFDLDALKTIISTGVDSSVLLTFAHESITEDILDIADVSLRLREIEGTLFVQPEKPWASFFAVENSKGNGIISVRPMV